MVEIIDSSSVVIEEMVEEVNNTDSNIASNKSKNEEEVVIKNEQPRKDLITRPDTVEAKVYKLKSRFVKERIYLTLSYINEDGKNRPIEIFINSKDLSKLPEYTVLTRLISSIFRHFNNPKFILDELQSVYDPNGGYFLKGKYIYSFYSEIAMIIERFFIDIGFMDAKNDSLDNWIETAKKANPDKKIEVNNFKICPNCNQKSLQVDGGCLNCINPECGYSKCN